MTKHENSRRFTEKSTKAAREFTERGAWGAEQATKGAKESLSLSVANVRELNITLIEMAHANSEAIFDLAHEIASAQAPSDLAAIWSAHARRRLEMMTNHVLELSELGQKLARRSTEPLTRSVNEASRHRTA
jgi:hypothetical protein